MYPRAPLPSLFLAILFAGQLPLLGCNRNVKPAQNNAAIKDVIARVNGVPITEFDLRQDSRGHNVPSNSAQRATALDAVIRSELLAQHAIEEGIDRDPLFQERIARAEALFRAARRRELADVLFRRNIVEKVSATDEEAETYYKKNEKRIRTELHVLQILTRDEAQAKRSLEQIKSGQSFEEVAAKQFDAIPEGTNKPWDLGFLRWRQMPPAWRATLFDLPPGSISDVIKGDAGRFWVLKVVEQRQDPTANLETMKPAILDELKAQLLEQERTRLTEHLRKKAQIVFEQSRSPSPPQADDQ